MKKQLIIILGFTVVFQLFSCEYLNTSLYTPKEIQKASSWSENDQAPNFPACQEFPINQQDQCFKEIISSTINNSLSNAYLIANEEINEGIILVIKVDKEGVISLSEIKNESKALRIIPGLKEQIESAISSLPKALPATKTNVGVFVEVEFELPIQLNTSTKN